jgi:glycerol uptake facilitator-like aquaporin
MSLKTSPTNGLKVFMEFTGTFILASSINLSTIYLQDGTQIAQPLMIILSFFSAITITRAISGGHVNPAVTIGVYFEKDAESRSKDQQLMTLYVIAQTLAALSACFFSYIFYRENIFKLAPASTTTPIQALLAEILGTFLLVYTILCQGKIRLLITKATEMQS